MKFKESILAFVLMLVLAVSGMSQTFSEVSNLGDGFESKTYTSEKGDKYVMVKFPETALATSDSFLYAIREAAVKIYGEDTFINKEITLEESPYPMYPYRIPTIAGQYIYLLSLKASDEDDTLVGVVFYRPLTNDEY